MVKIKLFINKSIEENASAYFEKGKKIKKKIDGARSAINKAEQDLLKLQSQSLKVVAKDNLIKIEPKWFHKFRWFISSEGFLVIGGRDATTNEIVIKKYTQYEDLVFHTEAPGSPFVVIKSEGKKIGDKTISETAQFTASFSRAWKLGIGNLDVFYVEPSQVSKTPQSGEYMAKGAFMIYGKKNIIRITDFTIAIGLTNDGLMAGPIDAIAKHTSDYFIINPGNNKASDIAKKMQKMFKLNLDDLIRVLPPGGCRIEKSVLNAKH